MRIVLDLQGAQSETSRFRGIGRFSVTFAQALAREATDHEIWLVLSGRFPDTIEPLRGQFADLIPQERIRVFESVGPVAEGDPANGWRTQASELIREKFLADLNPDIVHVSSMCEGVGNETIASVGRFGENPPTTALLYDLIPLLNAETHLAGATVRRGYLRHLQSLKRADLLLANSESARQDALRALRISPGRIKVIGAALAPQLQPDPKVSTDDATALLERYRLRKSFLLYAGALDPHKNIEGLISAFSCLSSSLRSRLQIVLAGKFYEEGLQRLDGLITKYGLRTEEIVPLGFVPDQDLQTLYRECAAFVFPSFYEGFGLPVLEAMSSGAAVLGSNRTSIPEIIDREDALFDPTDPKSIADRIERVICDPQFRDSLKRWGPERARTFTWSACVKKALAAFETLHNGRKHSQAIISGPRVVRRPVLAFLGPLPPDLSTAAAQSALLLPNLSRHYEIVCISEQAQVNDPWLSAECVIRSFSWFEAHGRQFERILYQFSDSALDERLTSLIERFPGIVLLPDFQPGKLCSPKLDLSESVEKLAGMLYDLHGFTGLRKWQRKEITKELQGVSCGSAVLRSCIGVIAHTQENIEITRECHGEAPSRFMRCVPALGLGAGLAGNPFASNDFPEPHEQSDSSELHPELVAERYRNVIEELYSSSSQAKEQRLLESIGNIAASVDPTDHDLKAAASAITANRESVGLRQILVDVTLLARFDLRTGIQRVTRGIVSALVDDPPSGYRIEPVRAVGETGYVYAREFACRCFDLPGKNGFSDDPVEITRGDIFLGLDLSYDLIPEMTAWFDAQKRRGMQIIFIVYDLIALERPHQFYPPIAPALRRWLNTTAQISDGLICISRTVTQELHNSLDQTGARRYRPLQLGYFHLGADIRTSLPSAGASANSAAILEALQSRPSFLMVGTLEPRKGYGQALDAFELLWSKGTEINLVIVGKEGWMVDQLVTRLKQHVQAHKRLFWLDGISDEMLETIYRDTRALIAASEAEGFGLPIIEAAQHDLPIIARDIPVFREVAGEHAYYFQGDDPQALADTLLSWISLKEKVPRSKNISYLSWYESSRQLLNVILDQHWYSAWPDSINQRLPQV